jgi:heat shock protein HslJ
VFERDMGATRADGPLPQPEQTETGLRLAVNGSLSFAIERRVCRDTMAGMPHPFTVTVTEGDSVLSGCGGQPADLLAGGWQVTEVAGGALDAGAGVTLAFDAPSGQVSGGSGCNRYFAGYTLTGEGLSFAQAGATMMACEEAQMVLERAFLDALAGVSRFDLTDAGDLVLLSGDTPVLRARR